MDDDIFNNDFDPLQDLEELKQFAHAADRHIVSLHSNQQVFVEQINELRRDILKLTQTLQDILEALEDETD